MCKLYEIPEELQDIMLESVAMGTMRDALVKRPFGFKKAKQCAIAQQQLKGRFWREVHVLYPELKGKTLIFGGDFVKIEQEAKDA
ncbi:hypothetical protein LCGC14_1024260 [marine sediment metagenome]|uniref:Uncharacterized protein n=1 Tax=marine sediment metagenome TaxID=412755 RepID=A0A0F9N128_9ZZZZ